MNSGKETWKWGLVVILLAVFLITANQAYQHIANQEVYEAPDDYLKGDSWDLEHKTGPGIGQPYENPSANNATKPHTVPVSTPQKNQRLSIPKPINFGDESNWEQENKTNQSSTKNNSVKPASLLSEPKNSKNIESEQNTNANKTDVESANLETNSTNQTTTIEESESHFINKTNQTTNSIQ